MPSLHRPWWLASLLAPGLWLSTPALAQLLPDATLGGEASLVLPGALIQGDLADQIGGGAIRGGNLFHSFLEFNIDAGQRVYFANPAGIEAILTRVTGGNPSNILGTLGVDGAADLFFINPNGLVFGENATLDIPGSFYASTAEAISLGEGVYSATVPEQSSLLTVNPSALFSNHLTAASGDIQSLGQLAAQGNLTLAANTVDLQGQVAAGGDLTLLGLDTVRIRDGVEAPFVGFAGGNLLVQGHDQVDIVALSHPDSGLYSYGDMVLRSGNPVGGDAYYWSGGNFRVETLDGDPGSLFSPIDPVIRALGDVEMFGYAGGSLHILAGGSVNIGTAIITAADPGVLGVDFLQETITLSDGTVVAIDGGAQPTLDVRAGLAPEAIGVISPGNISGLNPDAILLDLATTNEPLRGDITVGDVFIDAPNGLVLLTNQYQPNPTLAGGNIAVTGEGIYGDGIDARGFGGQGGTVYLDARNDVLVTNSSIETTGAGVVGDVVINAGNAVRLEEQNRRTVVGSSIAAGATGTGGDVRIRAATVEVLGGAQISASVFGNGDAGNVEITARDQVVFDGTTADGQFSSAAFSTVENGAVGTGGNIIIRTGSLAVTDGALLSTSTLGVGHAGHVEIEARDRVVFENADIFSRVGSDAIGDGGNITIRTGFLDATNGGFLSASTLGTGHAGNIDIEAREAVVFDSSDAVSDIGTGAVGVGGSVIIRAGSLDVLNGAQLSASTLGIGDAGNVEIEARDTVTFEGRSADGRFASAAFSRVEAEGQGRAGDIVISANAVRVANGASVESSTLGSGDAGDVLITAQDQVALDNASTFSRVGTSGVGSGGNVIIHTGSLEVRNGGQLSSSTLGLGDAGNVEITARDRVAFDGVNTNSQLRSAAFSTVQAGAEGAGGNIVIRTDTLEMTNGAGLSASTFGTGRAGNVDIEAQGQVIFDTTANALSNVGLGAVGEGGSVAIRADSLAVLNGAQLNASTLGIGDAGNVEITAQDRIIFDGTSADGRFSSAVLSRVGPDAQGNGGNVVIRTGSLTVTNGAQILANTEGTGDAGNVDIEARDQVVFDGRSANGQLISAAFSRVNTGAEGAGGNVVIRTGSLSLTDGAQLLANTEGTGNAGNVVITAQDQVLLDNANLFSSVGSEAIGTGGNVVIRTGSLAVLNGAQLLANTSGAGDAGDINIEARDTVVFDGTGTNGQFSSAAFSRVDAGAVGNGGNVVIRTGSLAVLNGAQLLANTLGTGDAGDVAIEARDTIVFDGTSVDGQFLSAAFSSVGAEAAGAGGNVILRTGSLTVSNGAQLAASTFGRGNAGNVEIEARGTVVFDGTSADDQFVTAALSNVGSEATGAGGDVVIRTGSLEVTNGAQLVASTFGTGNAGNVNITAQDWVIFDGVSADGRFGSAAFSTVEAGGIGTGGNVILRTGSLAVTNGGQLLASTRGNGNAGNVEIEARDAVVFEGRSANGQLASAAFSSVEAGAIGDGGNVVVRTGSLDILNGAALTTNTLGDGDAGNVDILARDQVNLQGTSRQGNPSGIFTNNTVTSTGRSNNIQITAPVLTVQDGAVMLASTSNGQPGGNITLTLGSLEVLNGGQVATGSVGTGPAGTIRINATEGLLITGSDPNFANRVAQVPETASLLLPQSAISVQASGSGTAGNIILGDLGTTPLLVLDQGGRIVAEAAAGDGGNIVLRLSDLLLLRNGSLISTTAGTAQTGGDGGNITITVPFIIALREENSDIAADAFAGTGGRVTINARGIFGIEPRPQRTPFSDITASSELGISGVVTLNTLDTSAITNSLTSLDDAVIDTSLLTAGSCIARTGPNQGSFVVTGSGGLPLRPGDSAISSYPTGTVRTLATPTAALQEPDGVYQLPDGRLVLSRACESVTP
ncbi:MAG: filamentous hemagglutinin N-terminal domain-containing protein [Spirulina sp.]